jgi:hypothetical protein
MAETRLTSLSVTGFRNYAGCQLDITASNVLLLGPERRWQDQPAGGDINACPGAGAAPGPQ